MNENAVARLTEHMPIPQADPIVSMIERAARDPAVDIDKLERLLAMQERILAQNARAAYADALAAMQCKLPSIVERGKIDIGRGKPQFYALWEDINDAIKPHLSDHGFALTFRTGFDDGKVVVTGILRHRGGHQEETTMYLPVDTSGSKNAVQAIGSSTSYGKRYTAAALLNLTSRGEDDDGRKGGGDPALTDEQADKITALLTETKADVGKFLEWVKAPSISDIPQSRYEKAIVMLEKKRADKGSAS